MTFLCWVGRKTLTQSILVTCMHSKKCFLMWISQLWPWTLTYDVTHWTWSWTRSTWTGRPMPNIPRFKRHLVQNWLIITSYEVKILTLSESHQSTVDSNRSVNTDADSFRLTGDGQNVRSALVAAHGSVGVWTGARAERVARWPHADNKTHLLNSGDGYIYIMSRRPTTFVSVLVCHHLQPCMITVYHCIRFQTETEHASHRTYGAAINAVRITYLLSYWLAYWLA